MELRKTAIHAFVVTLVIAFFLFRAGDWTKGIDSEFVVYGQSGPPAPPTITTRVTKVIPQIAVGSFDRNVTKYKTVIQVVNEGTAAATVSGNFYNEDGTASALVLKTNLSTLPTVTGGFASVSLPANGILVITADTASSFTVNWAKIVSTGGAVSTSAYFDLTDGDGRMLYSRVGVPPSDANLRKFTIPRVRNIDAGLDVGFALVNTGTTSASIAATLRSSAGSVLATKDVTLGAGVHTATFAKDFFALNGEASGTNHSFIVFESASAQFAAAALAIEGGSLSSFPVNVPGSSDAGTSTELADGSVTTAKLADNAVTGAKIATGQVVKSINSFKDDVTLTAGANITITAGQGTLAIAASGGTTGPQGPAGPTGPLNPNVITDSAPPFNTALGSGALISNTPGGSGNTSGTDNTAIGNQALNVNATGEGNTAIGARALWKNTTGSSNTASGYLALQLNTIGGANTASGVAALQNNTTGSRNTAIGHTALHLNTIGEFNTATGEGALESNTTGTHNTASGDRALSANTTGTQNTAIGYGANVSASNLTNATAIGFGATVNASNKIRLGNGAVTVIEGQVAYTYTSDKTKKENFRLVNAEDVLNKIKNLDVTSWNYIGNDPQEFRHYGPMAQDFFAAFGHDGLGTIGTPTTLTSGDIDGILVIALKAVEKRTAALQHENDLLKAAIEELKAQLKAIASPVLN